MRLERRGTGSSAIQPERAFAFELLELHRTSRIIESVRRRLAIRESDGADFAQDVWLHMLSKRRIIAGRFGGRSSAKTYVYRIVLNYGLNWLRMQNRLNAARIGQDGAKAMAWMRTISLRDPAVEYDEERSLAEARFALAKVLTRLTKEEQQTLWNWAGNRRSVGSAGPAAGQVGQTRNAKYCRVSRTLKRARELRAELELSCPWRSMAAGKSRPSLDLPAGAAGRRRQSGAVRVAGQACAALQAASATPQDIAPTLVKGYPNS